MRNISTVRGKMRFFCVRAGKMYVRFLLGFKRPELYGYVSFNCTVK
jgi:hypothetical protein